MKKYLAEIIGTFAIVTFGCGTVIAVCCDSASGSWYILTAWLLALSL